jgi:hypothetical protein
MSEYLTKEEADELYEKQSSSEGCASVIGISIVLAFMGWVLLQVHKDLTQKIDSLECRIHQLESESS